MYFHSQPFVTYMRPWRKPPPASHPLFCCSSFTWPFHSLLRRGTRDSTSSRWETLPEFTAYITEIVKVTLHIYIYSVTWYYFAFSVLSGCKRVLAADDESPSAKVGATRARNSNGGKTIYLLIYLVYFMIAYKLIAADKWHVLFLLLLIFRLTLTLELRLPLQRKTSSTNILV